MQIGCLRIASKSGIIAIIVEIAEGFWPSFQARRPFTVANILNENFLLANLTRNLIFQLTKA